MKKQVEAKIKNCISADTLPNDTVKQVNSLQCDRGPITKELVGIIKVKGKQDYKELLTDALIEKYI
jgi:hypothetical protein